MYIAGSMPTTPFPIVSRNTETLTTLTALRHIRIPKHKPRAQLILLPIHLTTDDTEQRLTVYQNFHAWLRLYCLVEGARFINVLEVVG